MKGRNEFVQRTHTNGIMETINKPVYTFTPESNQIRSKSIREVRESPGILVPTFADLTDRVAELSFRNPEYVLFYRGQRADYPNENGLTAIYPNIFRGDDYSYEEFGRRMARLNEAEEELRIQYNEEFEAIRTLNVYEILRWSIIQHYEICPTPLLDLTLSLHVACSFAFHLEGANDVFLFVIALPQISGSITTSSEHGVQIIRLLSVCPPIAKRPHYQQGYLVGEFPTIGYVQKAEYRRGEMDFGRRLICKFRLPRENFWNPGLPPIPKEYLFPDDLDQMIRVAERVRNSIR